MACLRAFRCKCIVTYLVINTIKRHRLETNYNAWNLFIGIFSRDSSYLLLCLSRWSRCLRKKTQFVLHVETRDLAKCPLIKSGNTVLVHSVLCPEIGENYWLWSIGRLSSLCRLALNSAVRDERKCLHNRAYIVKYTPHIWIIVKLSGSYVIQWKEYELYLNGNEGLSHVWIFIWLLLMAEWKSQTVRGKIVLVRRAPIFRAIYFLCYVLVKHVVPLVILSTISAS